MKRAFSLLLLTPMKFQLHVHQSSTQWPLSDPFGGPLAICNGIDMANGLLGIAVRCEFLDNWAVQKGWEAVMASSEDDVHSEHREVLIVDSDPAIRRILRLVLEGAGVSCAACASARDAVSLVGAYEPKLVLADVRLEDESGQELATALAVRGGWRPRIALMSAYPRPRRGNEDFFITKPIEFDRLLHLVEAVEHEPGW